MIVPKGFVKVTFLKGFDDAMWSKLYGLYRSDKVEGDYAPFCDLKKAIGSFYHLEFRRFLKQQKGFYSSYNEDYDLQKIVGYSLVVLRFTVAAALGEVRHVTSNVILPGLYPESVSTKEYRKAYKKAEQYTKIIMGGAGYPRIPRNRDTLYRSFVPEGQWLRYLTATRSIFYDLRWSSSFGGKKWGKGCDYAIRLYRELLGGSFSSVAICFDTLINHFHNGGLLLNKFECGQCMSLGKLLRQKQEGSLLPIQKLIETSPCKMWGESCDHALRTSPIPTKGDNNGKTEKEKEEPKEVCEGNTFVQSGTVSPGYYETEGSSSTLF